VQKEGDPNPIINCKKNIFMQRSVSADLTLEAGEYLVFLQIDAQRYRLQPVEDVVCENINKRRKKMLQVALNYDHAHEKVRHEVEEEEKAARKRERQELSKFKKEVERDLLKIKKRKKHLENKEKRKKRAAKAKKLAKARAKATKEAEEKAKTTSEGDKLDANCQTLEAAQPTPEKSPASQVDTSSTIDPVVCPRMPPLSADSSVIVTAPAADDDDDDSDLESDVSDVSSDEVEETVKARKEVEALEKKNKALIRRNKPAWEVKNELVPGYWNAVVVVGLRVYSKESGVSIKVVRPPDEVDGAKNKGSKRSRKGKKSSGNKKQKTDRDVPDGETALFEETAKEALKLIGDEGSEEESSGDNE